MITIHGFKTTKILTDELMGAVDNLMCYINDAQDEVLETSVDGTLSSRQHDSIVTLEGLFMDCEEIMKSLDRFYDRLNRFEKEHCK